MFTDKEKKIAQGIVEDTDMCAFLQKVFTTNTPSITVEMLKDKTDENLGQIIRADATAEKKIFERWNSLVTAGMPEPEEKEDANLAPE